MKPVFFGLLVLATIAAGEPLPSPPQPAQPILVLDPSAETIPMEQFADVTVYSADKKDPTSLTIVLTGDGNIDPGFIKMFKNLKKVDTMFVIVKTLPYLAMLAKSKDPCHNPATDLESLSRFIQKKYNFSHYVTPSLIGYSSGATLVYAVLVQAPQNTFRGAISLGFCPDLEIDRPLCKGAGLESSYLEKTKSYWMARNMELKQPWFALNGTKDTVCAFKEQKAFLQGLPNANLVPLKGVGHGFDVGARWVPQYKKAFNSLVEPNLTKTLDTLPE